MPVKKTVHFLGSLKLSFILLALLLLLLAERAIIAQGLLAETRETPWLLQLVNRLGLDAAADLNIPFFLVLAIFVVNLFLSSLDMYRRIQLKQQALQRGRKSAAIARLKNHAVFATDKDALVLIRKTFKAQGIELSEQGNEAGEMTLTGGRRLLGGWGVFFFHLSFFVILLGALFSFLTRFVGYAELIPGQTFIEQQAGYTFSPGSPPLLFGGDRGFALELQDIDISYWRPGEVKGRATIYTVHDKNKKYLGQRHLAVNRPFRVGDMKIYQGSAHGFQASLVVQDSLGTIARGTAHFAVPDRADAPMRTTVRLPGTDLVLGLELFTDRLGKIAGLEDLALRHRATLLKVYSLEGGRPGFLGVVFEGQRLAVEDLGLEFTGLAPYTSILAVRDYGIPVIFAGFAVLLLGLFAGYFWVPERYWVAVQKDGNREIVAVGATTEKFKESFAERFQAQMALLRAEAEGT